MAVDVWAGLSVAVVALPQAIAYAFLAGIPPAYGLSTAAVTGIVAAAAGRSPQVATGPTNTTGLLVLATLTPFLAANGLITADALPTLALLTLLAGVVRLVAALAGGASLFRFIPESVLVGFTAGAGTLIVAMQIDEALGLPPVGAADLRQQLAGVAALLADGQFPTLPAVFVTATSATVLAWARRARPRVPVMLLVVATATAGAWALGANGLAGLPLVGDRSPIPSGWPPIAFPAADFDMAILLIVPASAIALLGTLELAVSARAGGARPDMRREILAQGWANVAGALTGCFPASASFARSALLRLSGAQTRWAAAASGLFILPVVLAGSHVVALVPQASLAAVLAVVAYRMVDRVALRRLWLASPETRTLVLLTFVATLILPLAWAILLGSGTGLVIHLARTSAPRLRLLRPHEARLRPADPDDDSPTLVVEISGDLHYAAVPPFIDAVERLVPPTARHVVLDLSHAHQIRFTALRAFEQFADQLETGGGHLILAGVGDDVAALLQRTGSRLAFVAAEAEPGLSAWRAIEATEALPR